MMQPRMKKKGKTKKKRLNFIEFMILKTDYDRLNEKEKKEELIFNIWDLKLRS